MTCSLFRLPGIVKQSAQPNLIHRREYSNSDRYITNPWAEFLPEQTHSILRVSRPRVARFAGLFVFVIGEKLRLSVFGRHEPQVSYSGWELGDRFRRGYTLGANIT